jgi:hypothetical protein
MNSDPIRGQTIQFTFTDGPMAKKTFEHVFDPKGTVTFRMVGGENAKGDDSENAPKPKYEFAILTDDVGAVSYLGGSGYTLTTVLDFKTRKLVAFSSNEKGVSVQHGTFEYGEGARTRSARAH